MHIRGPQTVRLQVDGHDHGGDYSGRYFREQVVSVQAVDGEGGPIRRWSVNAADVRGPAVVLKVENDIMVRAVGP